MGITLILSTKWIEFTTWDRGLPVRSWIMQKAAEIFPQILNNHLCGASIHGQVIMVAFHLVKVLTFFCHIQLELEAQCTLCICCRNIF